MGFQFDAFISYSSADRDWADQVYSALRSSGQSVFFDYQSLRAGDDWEARIQSSLENCRSLVLLWSDHAKGSDWVTRELWSFVSSAKPKQNPNRRIIVVNLQGANLATKAYQQISRKELQRAYADGKPPTAADWQQTVSEVLDGLNPDKRPLSVPLVVLTLTLNDFEELSAGQRDRIRADFNLSDAFLRSRFGAVRHNWKPYAGSEPITALLEKIQNEVNAALDAHRIIWRQPEESFWTDIAAAKAFVKNDFNTSDLSVLIIDPVAVYQLDVLQRLMLFQDSLVSDRRVILTLPPFGVPPRLRRLRDALSSRATPYFDDYFQPAVPPRRKLTAQCAWNVTDAEDIKRHILVAAGYLGIGPTSDEAPSYLRQGQRG
jgi:TIR domain